MPLVHVVLPPVEFVTEIAESSRGLNRREREIDLRVATARFARIESVLVETHSFDLGLRELGSGEYLVTGFTVDVQRDDTERDTVRVPRVHY